MKRKSAQEEMIGFALIIILVAVIFLIFLGFSLRNSSKDSVESYEVESFLQGVLQYTSDCELVGRGFRSIQDLIFDCYGGVEGGKMCLNEASSCDILTETLEEIADSSWKAGEEFPVKKYELKIKQEGLDEAVLIIKNGVELEKYENMKGDSQPLSKAGMDNMELLFRAYY